MSNYILYNEEYFANSNIQLSDLGSDSVVIENKETQDVYICGHFKEFKTKKTINDDYILNTQVMKNNSSIEGQDMKFINVILKYLKVI